MKALKIEVWPIEQIVPYEKNAKIHSAEQVARIAKSIQDSGWDQPIVVDKHGVIIKGHGRRLAAQKLGFSQVPVIVRSDLTDKQVRAARLADNRVAVGDVDPEVLRAELADLDLSLLDGIFDAKELDFLTADLTEINPAVFAKDVPEPGAPTVSAETTAVVATDQKPVAVAIALGFKNVPGAAQRAIARFMAQIEAQYELPPAEAFLRFVEERTKEAA